jgi:hypothetical protein
MENKIENKTEVSEVHEKKDTCMRLDIALADAEFVKTLPQKVLEALKSFNYIRNNTYNAYVAICVNGASVETTIRHGTMFYRSACDHICMQLYVNYGMDNCAGKCVSLCEKVHREEAFLALVDNYRLLTYELRTRGIDYNVAWDTESPPLMVKITITQ